MFFYSVLEEGEEEEEGAIQKKVTKSTLTLLTTNQNQNLILKIGRQKNKTSIPSRKRLKLKIGRQKTKTSTPSRKRWKRSKYLKKRPG